MKQKNSIRVERAKRRLTQDDLAKHVNLTRQSIHLIENGKTEPKLSVAAKIAKFFGLPISELFNINYDD